MTSTTSPEHQDLPAVSTEVETARRETFRALLGSRTFLVGVAVVVFWAVCAAFGETLAPQDPLATNLSTALQSPSRAHWFGTDDLGRDVFSRVIVGARDIITVSLLATLLGTLAGTTLGLALGYFKGLVDDVVSRVLEAFLALPVVIVALLALTALGPSSWTVVLVIGVLFTPVIARTVRAAVLAERDRDYVAAAYLRAERTDYLLFMEILPAVLPPIVVEFTIRIGYAIFTIATLSFLGFGIQPPAPDWGLQIANSYGLIAAGFWWTGFFPAISIASLVIGCSLISDGAQSTIGR